MRSKLAFFAVPILAVSQLLLGASNGWTGGGPVTMAAEIMVQAPSSPAIVYAAFHSGLFKSTDAGVTWMLKQEYLPYRTPFSIAVSHADAQVVYLSHAHGDIQKSIDGGDSWTTLQPDPERPGTHYFVVALDGRPETLVAAQRWPVAKAFKSVFTSTDGGSSWTASPLSSVYFLTFAAAFLGNQPILYGNGLTNEPGGDGFYRSTDGGASWDLIDDPGFPEELVIDRTNPKVIYYVASGLYKTTDSGATWKELISPEEWVTDVQQDREDPSVLYAATSSGIPAIRKSTDAGQNWQVQSTEHVWSLLLLDPSSMLGNSDLGILRSSDQGRTWQGSSSGVTGVSRIREFYADARKPGVAWATSNGLWKTSDAGKTWTRMNDFVTNLALSPADPRIMYATFNGKLQKSTDEGRTWSELSRTFFGLSSLLVNPYNPEDVYVNDSVFHHPGWGLIVQYWHSPDGGITWEQIDALPQVFSPITGEVIETTPPDTAPFTLVVSPLNPDILYAGTLKGVFKSTDGGSNWQASGLQAHRVEALALDPLRPATLLAGVGLEPESAPGGAFNPSYSLYRSDDGGATWYEFNQGLSIAKVERLTFGADHIAFAVAGGVFAAQLDGPLFFPHLTSEATGQFTGLAVANATGTPVTGHLEAFDTAGRALKAPVDFEVRSGTQWSEMAGLLLGSGFDEAENRGWARVSVSPFTGSAFFSLGAPDLSLLDTAEAVTRPMNRFVFPEVQLPPAVTRLQIANANPESATVSLQLRRSNGQPAAVPVTRQLAANGALVTDLTDLFPAAGDFTEELYLDVSSDRPVVPFEQLWREGQSVAGLNGQDTGSRRLYCPQYASGPDVRSAVSIVNLDSTAGWVSLRFVGNDGVQIGQTQSVAIEPLGKVFIPNASLFVGVTETSVGYLEILSDGPSVAGSVVFGDPSGQKFASALPLQAAPARRLVHSHLVSSADFFTGLAVVNPGADVANVSIEVFSRHGERIASTAAAIGAGEKTSRLLTEHCPELSGRNLDSGYIIVTSDQEVFSFALFGAFDLRFLAAIQGRRLL